MNELTRILGLDKRNLVKKIKELESAGVLVSHVRGNLRLYSLDHSYFLLNELKAIFLKTKGLSKIPNKK